MILDLPPAVHTPIPEPSKQAGLVSGNQVLFNKEIQKVENTYVLNLNEGSNEAPPDTLLMISDLNGKQIPFKGERADFPIDTAVSQYDNASTLLVARPDKSLDVYIKVITEEEIEDATALGGFRDERLIEWVKASSIMTLDEYKEKNPKNFNITFDLLKGEYVVKFVLKKE